MANACRKYLEQMVAAWAGLGHPAIMENFVLRNGEDFDVQVEPHYRGRKKECFKNAFEYARKYESQGVRYVEGYGLSDIGLAMHHAWCVDADGRVMDPTWEYEETSYVGVVLPLTLVTRQILRNGVYGVLDPGMIDYKFMVEMDPGMRELLPKRLRDS
jgi:hypothetical protein